MNQSFSMIFIENLNNNKKKNQDFLIDDRSVVLFYLWSMARWVTIAYAAQPKSARRELQSNSSEEIQKSWLPLAVEPFKDWTIQLFHSDFNWLILTYGLNNSKQNQKKKWICLLNEIGSRASPYWKWDWLKITTIPLFLGRKILIGMKFITSCFRWAKGMLVQHSVYQLI